MPVLVRLLRLRHRFGHTSRSTVNPRVAPTSSALSTALSAGGDILSQYGDDELQRSASQQDGAEVMSRRSGKKKLVKRSLGFLSTHSYIRRPCLWLVANVWFDRFILGVVLTNTIILGIADYSEPWEDGPNPTKLRNRIIDIANTISLVIFLLETIIKTIALGLVWGEGTYLSNNWNRMDFIVVLTGLLSWLNLSGNKISMIRVLRVLRPLRTLNAFPGLKILVICLMSALPALVNVAILLSFSYLVFAILGMEIWRGTYHYRCRLTPYPVLLNFNASNAPYPGVYPNQTWIDIVTTYPELYKCPGQDTGGAPLLEEALELEDTPTRTARSCFWPIDKTDDMYCGGTGEGRQCGNNRWCGSNYFSDGTPRFLDVYVNGSLAFPLMSEGDHAESLNYGLTSFDNIYSTLIIIVQIVTASGWMALTQNTQDAYSWVLSGVYFNLVMFLGMCFLLQLNMAVIFSEFDKAKAAQALQMEAEAQQQEAREREEELAKQEEMSRRKSESESSFEPIAVESRLSIRLRAFRLGVRAFVKSPWFHLAGVFLGMSNIVVMASDHYPMKADFQDELDKLNLMFLIVFGLESAVKVYGLGWKRFKRDSFNLFDASIVVLGMIEMAANPPQFIVESSTKGGSRPFTALRAIRIFKVARSSPPLHKLMTAIGKAMQEILNFLFFLVLFLYIYALIGMELFATRYKFDVDNYPRPFNSTAPGVTLHRNNFDTIHWAIFTVFQVITYDNFPAIMYDGWLAVGWASPIYFVSIIVLGVWIVMNMFSAILVQSCTDDGDDGEEAPMEDDLSVRRKRDVHRLSQAMLYKARTFRRLLLRIARENAPQVVRSAFLPSDRDTRYPSRQGNEQHDTGEVSKKQIDDNASQPSLPGSTIPQVPVGKEERISPRHRKKVDRSLFIFSPDNPVRRLCIFLVTRKEWDAIVAVGIALSCVLIALDSPLMDPSSILGTLIKTSNTVFAVVFTVEMGITVIAFNFMFGPRAYLKDGWRMLDFFIVVVSLVALFIDGNSGVLSGLRALRSLRALRPLRVINTMPQLKLVVNTLFRCMPDILKTLLFFFFMLFLFGIICVMYFKGALNSCSISPYNYGFPGVMTPPPWFPPTYNGSYSLEDLRRYDLMTFPRSWQEIGDEDLRSWYGTWNSSCGFSEQQMMDPSFNPTSKQICLCFTGMKWEGLVPQSFDNIFRAIGSLFELTSMEGWAAVAMATVDAQGPDLQPITNNNPGWAFFWMLFMIVCAFFVTNLFIGVLCDSFMRENYGSMVTDEQIQWIKAQRKVLAISPIIKLSPPANKLRLVCYRIVTFKLFDPAIILCIFVNIISMASQYYGQARTYSEMLGTVNHFFVAVFTTEAALKMIAFGRKYFLEGWNQFDFGIVLLSMGSYLLPLFSNFTFGPVATVVRVFRVGRALRLVNKAQTMRNLFETLLVSLPAVGNVTSLLMLLYYIYAAVGVQLFGKVAIDGDLLNSHQNFQTFWLALQTLIGFSTGENWDNFLWEVYWAAPESNPNCTDRAYDPKMCGFTDDLDCVPLDGCGSWLIVPYMYSFFLVVGYVGLNLFSGIVVDAIGDASDDSLINARNLSDFTERWAEFDPMATCLISSDKLVQLLSELNEPLGFKNGDQKPIRRLVMQTISQMEIPVYEEGLVHFKDISRALVQRALSKGDMEKFKEMNAKLGELGVYKQFDEVWQRKLGKKIENLKMTATSPINSYFSALVIKNFINAAKLRKQRRQQAVEKAGQNFRKSLQQHRAKDTTETVINSTIPAAIPEAKGEPTESMQGEQSAVGPEPSSNGAVHCRDTFAINGNSEQLSQHPHPSAEMWKLVSLKSSKDESSGSLPRPDVAGIRDFPASQISGSNQEDGALAAPMRLTLPLTSPAVITHIDEGGNQQVSSTHKLNHDSPKRASLVTSMLQSGPPVEVLDAFASSRRTSGTSTSRPEVSSTSKPELQQENFA